MRLFIIRTDWYPRCVQRRLAVCTTEICNSIAQLTWATPALYLVSPSYQISRHVRLRRRHTELVKLRNRRSDGVRHALIFQLSHGLRDLGMTCKIHFFAVVDRLLASFDPSRSFLGQNRMRRLE